MYSFESKVRYSECDERGYLSLLSLINYLQDSSTFHSEHIGRGVEYMSGRHIAWFIAAWQIEIVRLPRFCDDIKVSTWCHTMARALASRSFTISDADGTQLVRAESLWFVYDFDAGRPIKIPDDQYVYVSDEKPLGLELSRRKLRTEGAYVEAPPITVDEPHLDVNRHVNNAQYLGMAANALAAVGDSAQARRPEDIARITIEYRQQALKGDVIVPRVHTDEGGYTIDLVNPAGESYAVVRIVMR